MRKSNLKSNIVLMELIICILFFSLSTAVCVKIFAASYSLSKQSAALTGGVLAVQSMAEVYKAQNGDIKKTAKTLNLNTINEEITVFYDNRWYKNQDNSSSNYVKLTKTSNKEATVTAHGEKGQIIFSIDVKAGG